MDEEIIDTVYAYSLELGDRIEYMDPEDGRWVIDTVKDLEDSKDQMKIYLEDRDDPLEVDPEQRFDLYGYTAINA